ncbi:MAG TPA: hypothetical protein VF676_08840 [Flavobacterium sp.]|jgi:hypothetical protein
MDTEKENLEEQKQKNLEQQQSDQEDFLGTEHGNAMPKPETATGKILNPEENPHLKEQPNRPATDDETPSIH